jgi:DNA-directed RNA polymerase sigma subunit (sigma70/sigma32)
MTLRAAEDGWPYPDALGDFVDIESGYDDELLSITNDSHLMDTLNPIEREVVAARFGLRGHEVRTMKQLHADLGLPRADLRLALGSGLAKLRDHLA